MRYTLIFAGAAHENKIKNKRDARTFNNPDEAPHDFLIGFSHFQPLPKILCYDPAYPISTTIDDIEYIRAVLPDLSYICDLSEDSIEKCIVFNYGYAEAQHFSRQFDETPVKYTWVNMRGGSGPELDQILDIGDNMGLNSVFQIRDYSIKASKAGLVKELLYPIEEARPFLSQLIYFPTTNENFDLLYDFLKVMQEGDSAIHKCCQRLIKPVTSRETWYAKNLVEDRRALKAYIFADAI